MCRRIHLTAQKGSERLKTAERIISRIHSFKTADSIPDKKNGRTAQSHKRREAGEQILARARGQSPALLPSDLGTGARFAFRGLLLLLLAFAITLTPHSADAVTSKDVSADRTVKKFKPFVPTDPIMPLTSVKPGMKGFARTVIRGREIVSIPVEVLEVIPQSGVPRNLILIRASGKLLAETGGIAKGMSGSPVYIGGKLAGAIGYGWGFSRHDMGLVTPIEDMIAIWDNPERIPSFAPAPIIPEQPAPVSTDKKQDSAVSGDKKSDSSGDKKPISKKETKTESADLRPAESSKDTPLSDYIFVNGVSSRMAESIGRALNKKVMPFGGGSEGGQGRQKARYNAELKPGMAIGASLVWGDVSVGAIGTLSAAAADGRFVGFAHPMALAGSTSFALSEASIARVIPGVASPFKLGYMGDIIGIVTQDRPQGIGGRAGVFAPAMSCTVNFRDVDSARTYKRGFQVVHDEYAISNLASSAVTGCIENLWGRSGGGSAKITTTYTGGVMPNGWSRTNIFVSEKDVAADMLKEFTLLTQALSLNQFQELRPFGMDVSVEMTQEPRILYIEDVKVPEDVFKPGDRVSFDITLRPWRKAPFVRSYSLVIPKNISGICELLVRGGGIAEEAPEYLEAGWRSISSLPVLLKEIDAKETNDQIVIELRGQEALNEMIKKGKEANPKDLMNDKLKSEIREEKIKEGSMRIVRSNYYVSGLIHKLIKVEAKGK